MLQLIKSTSAKNYLFDLSNLHAMRVIGSNAVDFLQGQLSCDLREVNSHTIRQAAMCSLKGRILALMDVLNWHGIQLVMPSNLINMTALALAKTAMLSKVSLESTVLYSIYGFYLKTKDDLLPNLILPTSRLSLTFNEDSCCYYVGNNSYIIIVKREKDEQLTKPFIEQQQMRNHLDWHQLQLSYKNILIYPETRDKFLPHRLDLHQTDHLSFNKGCYKGQEIIARTHYRAKLKHSLKLFTIVTTKTISAGSKLFDASGKTELGELIDLSYLGNDNYLIATSILFEHPCSVQLESHQKTAELIPLTLFNLSSEF